MNLRGYPRRAGGAGLAHVGLARIKVSIPAIGVHHRRARVSHCRNLSIEAKPGRPVVPVEKHFSLANKSYFIGIARHGLTISNYNRHGQARRIRYYRPNPKTISSIVTRMRAVCRRS